MENNTPKKKRIGLSRKTVVIVLILLSFVMSTSTFAYWVGNVEGAFNSHEMTFTLGSTSFEDYEFILYNQFDEGESIINNDYIVIDSQSSNESYDIVFGIVWDDDSLPLNTSANIEFEYEVYAEINGREVNGNKYKKIDNVLNISFDELNSSVITANDGTESFRITVSAKDDASKNNYRVFERSDVMIIVTYKIVD